MSPDSTPTSPSRDSHTDSLCTRVVSGVRATGRLHLGNYLGSIKTFISLCDQTSIHPQGYFFVADLHTLTTVRDPVAMRALVPTVVLDLLAAGIDPNRVTVFAQSAVPETSELAWLLSSVTWVGELERLPAFREKEQRRSPGSEPLNVGLLNYPLLMAADILGPRAHIVPVGEDQYPHLELVRDIVRRLNRRTTGDAPFPEPQAPGTEPVRVPGLDGSGKMGKSEHNALALLDPPDERWAVLSAAATDPGRRTKDHPGTPERCPIYAMHQLVSSAERVIEVATGCRSASLSCVECKNSLREQLDLLTEPMRARREVLVLQKDLVRDVLSQGSVRARKVIRETRDIVQDMVGITRYES